MEAPGFNIGEVFNAIKPQSDSEDPDPKGVIKYVVDHFDELNPYDALRVGLSVCELKERLGIEVDPDLVQRVSREATEGAFGKIGEQEEPLANAEEARRLLEDFGIVPSSENAKRTFWLLGENWWRQIIDGKFQEYGEFVFDKGLHGGHTEPGYLQGIHEACTWASDNWDTLLTESSYRDLHEKACAHFKGPANDTQCMSFQINSYRKKEESTGTPPLDPDLYEMENELKIYDNAFLDFAPYFDLTDSDIGASLKPPESFRTSDEENLKEAEEKAQMAKTKLEEKFPEYKGLTLKEASEKLKKEISDLKNKRKRKLKIHCDTLNQIFKEFSERYKLEKPLTFAAMSDDVRNPIEITYQAASPEVMSSVVTKLFENAENELKEAQLQTAKEIVRLKSSEPQASSIAKIKKSYQEEIVRIAANLYADLEWTHPWIDGQGRTDLILLSSLLTREGLHPPILMEPYTSTTSTRENWIAYLKQGLSEFENTCIELGVDTSGSPPKSDALFD